MRILINTEKKEIGDWAREQLQEFGRGMHITVIQEADSRQLSGNWSYIITIGNCSVTPPEGKPVVYYPATDDEGLAEFRRKLWALYRDNLRDMIGSKCSCGLYDICHCH